MTSVIAIFALSLLIAWSVTWCIRWVADRFDVIARRDWRRQHTHRTPLLGGTGIYLSILTASYFFFFRDPFVLNSDRTDHQFNMRFIAAVTLIYLIGVIDDIRELKMRPKLTIEILASLLIVSVPGPIQNMALEYGIPVWFSNLVLMFWMIGITNASNFIDGMDGLCSSMAFITGATLTLTGAVFFGFGGWPVLIGAALCGSLLGFLFHNWNPAKIFLGDSGSLLVGFTLSVLAIGVCSHFSRISLLFFPVIALAVPILDVTLAVIRRLRAGVSPFDGDRSHIHHRLLNLGLSEKKSLVVICAVSFMLNLIALQVFAVLPYFRFQAVILAAVLISVSLLALNFIEKIISDQAQKSVGSVIAIKGRKKQKTSA